MTPDERAVIERAVIEQAIADVDVSGWAPLDDQERDLCSRAFRSVSHPVIPGQRPARTRSAAPA
ncbi:hypothetical protein GCM10025792_47000 [Pseudonocardia tropica]